MRQLIFDRALTTEGWRTDVAVAIGHDGRIAAVEAEAATAGAERVRGAAIPGLVNVHSHAFQRGMAGLTEHAGATEDSFWTWREVMYHFLGRLQPDDVEAIAAFAYAEMLEAGFTRVGEFHYLHHDLNGRPYARVGEMAERIAAAAGETGIGLTLLPTFYAHGNFGGAQPVAGQRRFLCELDTFARLLDASRAAIAPLPHANLGIAPHSLRAVTLDELNVLVVMDSGCPIHMHLSEQTKEVDDCLAAHGCRPGELLFRHFPVDARWCLIHATHTDAAERAQIAASGAVVGLCPITEANLGDGIFDGVSYVAADGAFAIGTDSNVLISAAGELRTLEYAQRLSRRTRNALAARRASSGRTLVERALRGGAQALGLGKAGIAPGSVADIVVLDTDDPAFVDRTDDALLDAFVFTRGERAIRDVWAAGRHVVRDGRHVAREAIAGRYTAAIRRVLAD